MAKGLAKGLAKGGSLGLSDKGLMSQAGPVVAGIAGGAIVAKGAMMNWADGVTNAAGEVTDKQTGKAAMVALIVGVVGWKVLGRYNRKAGFGVLVGALGAGLLRVADDREWTTDFADWLANHDGNPDNDTPATTEETDGGRVDLGTRLRQYYQGNGLRSVRA